MEAEGRGIITTVVQLLKAKCVRYQNDGLPDRERSLAISSAFWIEYTNVTDRQTDRQTDG